MRVYLLPLVLHGDGTTQMNLPSYAFRNSDVHEIGRCLALDTSIAKGITYLMMAPQFDFREESDQLLITMLELDSLVKVYGTDGFELLYMMER